MYSGLEVWHDGKPFTESNVQSLCDAANSDKTNDNSKIGKFGVGFKSVFAICNTVELYSEPSNRPIEDALPKFAIKIDNYTDPTDIDDEEVLERPYTTKFVFPYFCGDYKSTEDLIIDVAKKLCSLGTSVLLFMKNIEEIDYSIFGVGAIPDSTGVYMLKKDILSESCIKVTALGETNHKESDESYLVFSKQIPQTEHSVDLAFSISENKGKIKFIKSNQPFVFVYFPTETESKLNFIIQAPFDLTPNRSSLRKDSEHNLELIEMITSLFRKAIFDIKANNWLTLELIDLLPYDNTYYGSEWHFSKLNNMTLQMLEKEQILPTIDGNYVNTKNAKIVRGAKLLDLLEDKKLCELLNELEAKWLPKEFTESSPLRALHQFLIRKLNVVEIGTNELPKLIRSNPQFLQNSDDDWLAAFYRYLTENATAMLGKNGDLATVPFVKTAGGTFSAPFTKRGKETEAIVFVRPKNANFNVVGFTFIDEFVEQNCPEFIKMLGLTEPDRFDYFIKELESIEDDEEIDCNINLSHTKTAVKYLLSESSKAIEYCSRLLWIRVSDTKGNIYYVKSHDSEIYREKDFNNVSLKNYLSDTDCNAFILDEQFYLSGGMSSHDLKTLEMIGLKNSVYEGLDRNYWYDGNAQCTNIGDFKKQLNFAHLQDVLNSINRKKLYRQSISLFFFLKNVEKHLSGQWEYGSTHPRRIDGTALILYRLTKHSIKWLFSDTGELVCPSDISRYDLDSSMYGEVDKLSSIYELLGFKKTERDKQEDLVREFISRYSQEQINILIQNIIPKENDVEFDPTVDEEYDEFPEESIKNLQRLIDTVKQYYKNAPNVQYEPVLRSVRTSRGKDKEHIRYRYHGYCQMCEDPSRFWEVVQIFKNPRKELEQMNLSLCPSCAAMYRQMRNNDSLMSKFANEIVNTNLAGDESVEIDEKYIRFTKAHLAEIQTIINIERNNRKDVNVRDY